jgi:hypothetical protein
MHASHQQTEQEIELFPPSRHWNWILVVLTPAFPAQNALGSNRLQVKNERANVLTIGLSNTDQIAGLQFSVNGRGGITFTAYKGSDRTTAAGIAIYEYLNDDSTLNVVMLAPYRSSLPIGDGVIGEITFTLNINSGTDTIRVFLSGVVTCNVDGEYLDVNATQLAWDAGKDAGHQLPRFTLEQNFPNPFNPSTTLAYRLETPGNVRLTIFDITGRQVAALIDQFQLSGNYAVKWSPADKNGLKLPSGIYFVRLQVDQTVAVKKLILAK